MIYSRLQLMQAAYNKILRSLLRATAAAATAAASAAERRRDGHKYFLTAHNSNIVPIVFFN
jgi:hypothetical protein